MYQEELDSENGVPFKELRFAILESIDSKEIDYQTFSFDDLREAWNADKQVLDKTIFPYTTVVSNDSDMRQLVSEANGLDPLQASNLARMFKSKNRLERCKKLVGIGI